MSGHILRIYAMTVCFFTLMCGAIALGIGVFNLVKLTAPSATIHPATIQHLHSLDEFRQSAQMARRDQMLPGFYPGPPVRMPQLTPGEVEALSDEELDAMRLQQLEQAYANHRFQARQALIQQSIVVSICAVLFLLHWRLARSKPEDASA